MISRKLIPLILIALLVALFAGVRSAAADSSHARIIRLSLVQGDVRYARETHGDPLADSNAGWETAGLNLPIRQGYVVATDNGRAEVEFENGAMAFLKENTVLQFFDLSLKDGALTTRLVLLQGSASFYVNPAQGDYFSVTGGDFTVEANGRATFRVDNYSDGSTVEDERGPLTVLHGDQTTRLNKGQSLSMKAGDQLSVNVGRVPAADEFDQWVSGRVDSVSTATTAALQYTNSPYYTPGFASLYSYGSFSNCGGYGYGWRPFGAGFGWSPFTDGQWIMDPAFGWTWVSFQPWGWAPYHYGGWLFDSGCGGWFYSPPLYYGYYPGTAGRRPPRRVNPPRPIFHPATAVFVRNNGKLGLVPMHPLDEKGKTPLNFGHGVFSPAGSKGSSDQIIAAAPGQKWETLKSAPKDAFTNHLQPSGPPVRVSRTVLEGASGTRVVSTSKDSSIAYDPKEHRFVNSNTGPASSSANEKGIRAERERAEAAASGSARNTATVTAASTARNSIPSPRNITPPRITTPPPAPRYSGGTRESSASGAGSTWGGSRSSGASSAGNSGHTASAPAAAPHASSGGRPH
jgi:hypothetical protein